MNTINIFDKKDCVGCGGCEQSCPKAAIQLLEDNEGFLYPQINNSKCINCGICEKLCPIPHKLPENSFETISKILILKDKEILRNSTSGGVFAGFAKYYLENGFCVYGCRYNESQEAVMEKIENMEQLHLFQSSKYVFSNNGKIYKSIKQDLEEGKNVLFCGRPCQIHGLKLFLKKEYENLLTMDLVCHGVPSQKLFKKYVNWLEKKYSAKVNEVNFRDKKNGGWSVDGIIHLTASNKQLSRKLFSVSDPYYSSFLRNESFRESCYVCKYANQNRIADITICDFWGISDYYPEICVKNGVSACLINSTNGNNLFKLVENYFYSYNCDLNLVAKRNRNLRLSSNRPAERDKFYVNIDSEHFFDNITCGGPVDEIKYEIKGLFAKFCPKFIKRLLKRRVK